jgi:abortive infection bacteriophage resistance protein
MRYTKPALTYEQQLEEKLLARGLTVASRERALYWLRIIGYFRLSAYFIPFRRAGSDDFSADATFADIVDLYKLDAKLRLLIMQAVDRIEVSLRASFTYVVAHDLGVFGYADPANFLHFVPSSAPGVPAQGLDHSSFMNRLKNMADPDEVTFVKHFRTKYGEEEHLPVWMATELITIGTLHSLISNLPKRLRKAIARNLGLSVSQSQFVSWVGCVAYIRNICAHHSRFWNRELSIKPELLAEWKTNGVPAERSYCAFVMLAELMKHIAPKSKWKERLIAHIDEHPRVDLAAMNFPADWKTKEPWAD